MHPEAAADVIIILETLLLKLPVEVKFPISAVTVLYPVEDPLRTKSKYLVPAVGN